MAFAQMERYLTGYLFDHPEQAKSYPELPKLLSDPLAKAMLGAVQEGVSGDIQVLLTAVNKKLKEPVDESVLAQALNMTRTTTEYDKPDPDGAYVIIRTGWIKEHGDREYKRITREYEAQKLTFEDMTAQMKLVQEQLSALKETQVMATENWDVLGPQMAEASKKKFLVKDYLTFGPNFPAINEAIPQISDGILVSLLMRTGTGKTSVAMYLAHWWGRTSGKRITYFNTELTEEQILRRWITRRHKTMTFSMLEEGQWDEECQKIMQEAKRDNVQYVSAGNWTTDQVIDLASRTGGPIIIDYHAMLNLGPETKQFGTETNAIGESLRKLKAYAQANRAVVLILWQTTKAGEGKNVLSGADAAGSKQIENKSNIILTVDFNKVETTTSFNHPFRSETVTVEEGNYLPIGRMRIAKGNFYPPKTEWVFLDDKFTVRYVPVAYREYAIATFKNAAPKPKAEWKDWRTKGKEE